MALSPGLSTLKVVSINHNNRKWVLIGKVYCAVRFAQFRPPLLALKPLFFQVPQQETEEEAELTQFFWGRSWIFREVFNRLLPSTIEQQSTAQQQSRGIIISGGTGSGKTNIALQLVEYSCFGRSRIPIHANHPRTESIYENPYASSSGETIYGRTSTNGHPSSPPVAEIIQSLAAKVVAYHFCQVGMNFLTEITKTDPASF